MRFALEGGRRRCPAVVDQDEKRSRAGQSAEAVPQRLRHRQNDERAHREAQGQDRPRRPGRLSLVRIEPDQQTERGEQRPPRHRRGHPQEEVERANSTSATRTAGAANMSGKPNTCQTLPLTEPSPGSERRMRSARRSSAADPSVRLRLMPQPRLLQSLRSASRCAASSLKIILAHALRPRAQKPQTSGRMQELDIA